MDIGSILSVEKRSCLPFDTNIFVSTKLDSSGAKGSFLIGVDIMLEVAPNMSNLSDALFVSLILVICVLITTYCLLAGVTRDAGFSLSILKPIESNIYPPRTKDMARAYSFVFVASICIFPSAIKTSTVSELINSIDLLSTVGATIPSGVINSLK